jgi:PAS domain S-box-containing protein
MSHAEKEALELAAILDTMADGVYVVDTHGVIQRWNRAMETITGFAAAEAVGKPCSLLRCEGCPEHPHTNGAMTCRLFEHELIAQAETRICGRTGATIPIIKSGRLLKNTGGELTGAVETITDISALRQLEAEVTALRQGIATRYEFHHIAGKSRGMREVFNLIELAAASQVNVLIQGETGTGKELVAKAIHYHSERGRGLFVVVNCAALSESLLESELFGHVRGAFTGAIKDHEGRFERANKGTIFLDEIGEIPLPLQVKLLRVPHSLAALARTQGRPGFARR